MSITDYMKDYQYCCTVSKSCNNNKILTWIRIFIMKGLLNPVPLMGADPDTKIKSMKLNCVFSECVVLLQLSPQADISYTILYTIKK